MHAVPWHEEHAPGGLRLEIGRDLEPGAAHEGGEHERRLDHGERGTDANPRPGSEGHELIARGPRTTSGEAIRIKPVRILPIVAVAMNRIDRNHSDGPGRDPDAVELEVLDDVAD